ncbi:MAG TPA: HAD family hydrolase [Dehalococcoidia bacterium]|nr:HAD family hydrolase [Dehalococcoidia bacterium]
MSNGAKIEAVAFDCYGTLIDFGDEAYARAYGTICSEQGLPLSGEVFYEKWMEIWRRLVRDGQLAATTDVVPGPNNPGPLSETVTIPPHPAHHATNSRVRPLAGPAPAFRTYREEWTEHFALCFEELGVQGDAAAGHEHLRSMLADAYAFEEARRTIEIVGRRLPIALMSNADDDFLYPVLAKNALTFPVVVSSEEARAYKPHESIFQRLSEEMGVAPENILYVGDSRLADVTGSKNAGMHAAWVNRGANNKGASDWASTQRSLTEPDVEVSRLDGLLEFLNLA